MADWNTPTLTSTYTSVLDTLKNRDIDAALMFDPALVTPTNLPTNAIRWNSAANRFEKFNGTAWAVLTTTYAIDADTLDGQHGSYYREWANLLNVPTTFTPSTHSHDTLYYTKTLGDARYGNNLFVNSNTIQLRDVNNTVLTSITVPYATNAGTVNTYSVGQSLLTNSAVTFSGVTAASLTSAAGLSLTATGANAVTTVTNGAERTRVTAAGDLLVGSTSATWADANRNVIEVNGASSSLLGLKTGGVAAGYLFATNTSLDLLAVGTRYLSFLTGGAERARLHASGGLSLGNTVDPGANNLSVQGLVSSNRLTVDGLTMFSKSTIDMSTLDAATYYPVTITIPPTGRPVRMRIQNGLNSNVPSWSIHPSGFSVLFEWTTNGSGYGVIPVSRTIHTSVQSWASVEIVGGVSQMTQSSNEVIYLRGGGIYYFEANQDVTPVVRSTSFTTTGETVSPSTTAINSPWYMSTGTASFGSIYTAGTIASLGGDISLVSNAKYFRSVTTNGTSVRMLGINSGDVAYVGPIDPGPTNVIFNGSTSSTVAAFYTGGTERLRIDASGNVGLGATPPANTTYPGLFFAQSGMFDYQGNGGLFYNAYTTGVGQLKYRQAGLQVAAYIHSQDGSHTWYNAAAGAANTAVDLVQRMKLTAAGNLGVGTLDPTDFGANYRTIQASGPTGGVFRASNTANTMVGDFFVDSSGVYIRTTGASSVPLVFMTDSTEKMRLGGNGNLGIGTANPGFILDVQGSTANMSRINVLRTGSSGVGAQLLSTGALAGVAATAAGPLALYTSDLERVYITAAGNVGIGTNTPADQLHLSSAAPNFRLTDTDTGGYTQLSAANSTGSFGIYVDQGNTVASSIFLLYIDGAEKVRVDATGNLTAVANITAYSDERLKTDIRTIPQALDLVQEMRGVFFEKDGTAGVGVIAQEMELVLPEVVLNGEFKSVAYGNIVGVLIEAIKELRAEVYSLKEV